MATIYDGIPMGYEDNTQNPYNYKQALREQLGSSPVPPQYYLRSFAPEPAQPIYPNEQAYIQSLLQEAARRQLLMEQMQNQRACGGKMFDDGGDLQAYQNMPDYMRQSEYNPETVYDNTPVQEVYDVPYEEYDPAGAILADKQANYPTATPTLPGGITLEQLNTDNVAYPRYIEGRDNNATINIPDPAVATPTPVKVEETTAKTQPLGKITATNTRDIQQELVNRGYLNNRVNSRGKHREVDGIWGARTAAAYKKYLEDQYKQDNGKDTLDRNDRKIIEGEIAKMNKEKKYNPYNKEKNTTVASTAQKKNATTSNASSTSNATSSTKKITTKDWDLKARSFILGREYTADDARKEAMRKVWNNYKYGLPETKAKGRKVIKDRWGEEGLKYIDSLSTKKAKEKSKASPKKKTTRKIPKAPSYINQAWGGPNPSEFTTWL